MLKENRMKVTPFTETRVTTGIKVETDENFFSYTGTGYNRADFTVWYGINAGPTNAPGRATKTDGVLPGTIKVTRVKGATDWYSVRSIGKDGNGRTVYLRGSARVGLIGFPLTTLDVFYTSQGGK